MRLCAILFRKNFYESVKWHLQLKRKWLSQLSLLVASKQTVEGQDDSLLCDRDDDIPQLSQSKAVSECFPKMGLELTTGTLHVENAAA